MIGLLGPRRLTILSGNDLLGKTLKIIYMEGEPQYTGRTGIVKSIDDMGQIHGSWGGCALIPGTDEWEVID